mgnify:CR=1 FL=1
MIYRGLGKGLSALLSDKLPEISYDNSSEPQEIDINKLQPGKYQPRYLFEENAHKELSDSIAQNGVIQPIIVTKIADSNNYSIIAGERRWRASKIAGLTQVPVILKQVSENEALEFAIIENVQRENLTPIEEAAAYGRLMHNFGYKQEDLAKKLGKSRSHIANILRLAHLPDKVNAYVHEGKISVGHAKLLVNLEKQEAKEIAEFIMRTNLNVRGTENLIKERKDLSEKADFKKNYKPEPESVEQNKVIFGLQEEISKLLGMPVVIKQFDNGTGGRVIISWDNIYGLDALIQKLSS